MSITPHTHRRRRRLRRCLAVFATASVLSLGAADGAFALGQITFGGCVSDSGSGGLCADVPGAPLNEPTDTAISPDGHQLYVASRKANAISVYGRQPAGQITFEGCVSEDGSGGFCADVPATLIHTPEAVAVSPDGKSLYVGTAGTHAVLSFKRLDGGQIVYDNCYADTTLGGNCVAIPGQPFDQLADLQVSPDGGNVYVANGNNVTVLNRAGNGLLTYAGCVSNNGSGGFCADPPGDPLVLPRALAISPSGTSVYVVRSHGVTVFDRAPAGQITYAGCVSSDGSGGLCADVPGAGPLDAADAGAVSPDGKQLYVTDFSNHSVTVFGRAAGGQITYEGCVSHDGSGGLCADAPSDVLVHPTSVAVSGDGGNVYVTGNQRGAVDVFDRAAGGQITFAGCVSDPGSAGACAELDGQHLASATALAISRDDNSVYAVGLSSATVVHFHRKTRPDTTITSGPADGSATADAQPRFAFAADQQNATFECSVDGAAFAACTSPRAIARLGDGSHTFAVRATAGGDTDATPATRRFTVDTTGPRVRFTRAPKGKLRTAKRRARARFAFESPEAGVRFQCKLDRRKFKPCSSPFKVRLAAGKHRLRVRGVDTLGNVGPAVSKRVRVVRGR